MCLCKRLAALALILLLISPSAASAEPYVPADDSQVLVRLPETATSDLRARLARDPDNLPLALEVARTYIRAARAEGDPRYNGYAQAALAPWLGSAEPPAEVLILRATLRQTRHDFSAALADLDRALAIRPNNPQAWLTRAVILQVQGRFKEAAASCRRLVRRVQPLIWTACAAEAASLAGQPAKAYRALRRTYESHGPSATPGIRLWVLTVLAEMAERQGNPIAAEAHYRAALALGQADAYLLGAYADFLLEQGRAQEVMALVPARPRPDGLLLRRALAERAVGRSEAAASIAALEDRFAASRRRGDSAHQRDEARFRLHLTAQPAEALALALDTWRVQREPWDARLVLEAALAAGRPAAARPVLDWLADSGLEDARLRPLVEALS